MSAFACGGGGCHRLGDFDPQIVVEMRRIWAKKFRQENGRVPTLKEQTAYITSQIDRLGKLKKVSD